MARSKPARPEVAEHRNYLDGVAKNLHGKLYGSDGLPWGTRFADVEELVIELGQHISHQLLETILQKQALQILPASEDLCPECSQSGQILEPEPRVVDTPVGAAEWDEPRFHCRRCRRSFFPSES